MSTLKRLNTILDVRSDLYVIARTDSCELTEGISRVNDYARVGADAVMVEGLSSLDSVKGLEIVSLRR